MTTKRGGRPYKGEKITDGFNQAKKGVRRADVRAAVVQAQIEKDEKAAKNKEIASLKARLATLREDLVNPEDPEESVDREADNIKGSENMLRDLRYGYKHSVGPDGKKGRDRLVDLMENDAEFKFAMKELMKIESALLAAKIRTKATSTGGSDRQSFFVVLKGLEQEKPVAAAFSNRDTPIDLKQVMSAINPETTTKYEPDEAKGSRDRPDEILKVAEREE